MTISVNEFGDLVRLLYPSADGAALHRIEAKIDALAGALAEDVGALTALLTQETTQLATTDQQIATIGADVQQVIALYSALKTDDANEAAQLAALQQSLADAQAADGAGSPRALALQSIVDALTPILTPAAPAPPPVDATGGTTDTTGTAGGTTDTTGTAAGTPDGAATGGGTTDGSGGDTTASGGDAGAAPTDQTPVPGDTAPSPDTGTGTDGSAGGPAA